MSDLTFLVLGYDPVMESIKADLSARRHNLREPRDGSDGLYAIIAPYSQLDVARFVSQGSSTPIVVVSTRLAGNAGYELALQEKKHAVARGATGYVAIPENTVDISRYVKQALESIPVKPIPGGGHYRRRSQQPLTYARAS